jgi:hypothetical protein
MRLLVFADLRIGRQNPDGLGLSKVRCLAELGELIQIEQPTHPIRLRNLIDCWASGRLGHFAECLQHSRDIRIPVWTIYDDGFHGEITSPDGATVQVSEPLLLLLDNPPTQYLLGTPGSWRFDADENPRNFSDKCLKPRPLDPFK